MMTFFVSASIGLLALFGLFCAVSWLGGAWHRPDSDPDKRESHLKHT